MAQIRLHGYTDPWSVRAGERIQADQLAGENEAGYQLLAVATGQIGLERTTAQCINVSGRFIHSVQVLLPGDTPVVPNDRFQALQFGILQCRRQAYSAQRALAASQRLAGLVCGIHDGPPDVRGGSWLLA